MTENKSPGTYKELLKSLLELLTESIDETPEEVDQYLRDAGYDPDALVARMRKRIKVAMDASPLNPKSQKEQSFHIELTGIDLTTLIIYLGQQFEIIASSNQVSDRNRVEKLKIIQRIHDQLEQAYNDQVTIP